MSATILINGKEVDVTDSNVTWSFGMPNVVLTVTCEGETYELLFQRDEDGQFGVSDYTADGREALFETLTEEDDDESEIDYPYDIFTLLLPFATAALHDAAQDFATVTTPESLREWRQAMDWTQDEAALALGCGRRSLQQWEAGTTDMPGYIGLACVAVAAGARNADIQARLRQRGVA